MNDDFRTELSEQGRARRDAMLAELQSRVVRTARVKRVRSGVLAAAALGLIASLAVLLTPHRVAPPASPVADLSEPTTIPVEAAPFAAPTILVVRTDPDVLGRCRASPDGIAARVERIGDDELLAELVAIGRPAGIIRSQGRTWLTAAVTDKTIVPKGSSGAG